MIKDIPKELINIVIKHESYEEYKKIWLILNVYFQKHTISMSEQDYKRWPFIFTNEEGLHGSVLKNRSDQPRKEISLIELEKY